MSHVVNPVYYNPLQTNAFKHVYGVLLQIQSNVSGPSAKGAKKTKYEEFFKACGRDLGKKGKVQPELVERYKRGSLSFLDFMDSICIVQDLRMREVGKSYTLCWDYYYTYIEPRLLDVNELPIIRKTHLFIYWLVFCAVDLDCSCELTADKICDLLSFLCENSFQEAGPSVYSSLRRTNYSYDFVTFIQIIFANCLKTLNDNMKGELARKLYDRFVKGVILSGFLNRQQVVGPIKSYIKRLCKLTPTKLEVYEIGRNNEQRLKHEIILNQHSQIAMIIKDFDPMKFYFQITCGHTQNIVKFYAEDEITRFKWITEMKRVIKYHMEGNVTYQFDIGAERMDNSRNLLYQVPDPKALPVLKGQDLNIETIEDLEDESASFIGGASVLTVNTSVSQQIRASVVDEIVEESLYNQVPTNRPVYKQYSDADTAVSEGSDDSSGDVKRPAPLGQEMADEASKPKASEEQVYENVKSDEPPPPIPGKKKQISAKVDDKRPVAAPRRKTERAPATPSNLSVTPPIQKPERTPFLIASVSNPGPIPNAHSHGITNVPTNVTNQATDVPNQATNVPTQVTNVPTQVTNVPSQATNVPSQATNAPMPQPVPRRKTILEPTTDLPTEPLKEPPATAPKPSLDQAVPKFDPPPPINEISENLVVVPIEKQIEKPIEKPVEKPIEKPVEKAEAKNPEEVKATETVKIIDQPPPKPAHSTKPLEEKTKVEENPSIVEQPVKVDEVKT